MPKLGGEYEWTQNRKVACKCQMMKRLLKDKSVHLKLTTKNSFQAVKEQRKKAHGDDIARS